MCPTSGSSTGGRCFSTKVHGVKERFEGQAVVKLNDQGEKFRFLVDGLPDLNYP